MLCFFVSDLHGRESRYQSLFSKIKADRPKAVFLGGDLFPPFGGAGGSDFLDDLLLPGFLDTKEKLGGDYPQVFLILGNDDSKLMEEDLIRLGEENKVWDYLHNQRVQFGDYFVYGYAYVPPTPFLNKDWERYDISRYVDPGCIPPEAGFRSIEAPINLIEHATIQRDLEDLVSDQDLSRAIFLFHAPPYQTNLDRAALDGKMIDHVPLDLHVGSIAVKEFILKRQPLITLHGHIHESTGLTGSWQERLGNTYAFSAAHDGEELALVRFSPERPQDALRELISG